MSSDLPAADELTKNNTMSTIQKWIDKNFPFFGRIPSYFNSKPLSLRILWVQVAIVLTNVFIAYLSIKFFLRYDISIISSTKLHFSTQSTLEGAGIHTNDLPEAFYSLFSPLALSESYGEKSPGQKEGHNNQRNIHSPNFLHHYRDHLISDHSGEDEESPLSLLEQDHQIQGSVQQNTYNNKKEAIPVRVLHIVTALTDYNTGFRDTIRGEDRLKELMIPVLVDSVSTMILPPYNYQVDVYLILGWKLTPERRRLIEDALPEGVGLEIWDDASPLGYDKRKEKNIKKVTRSLARQHRFVIKDKIDYYDLFSVFEDDMRVTGGHISHFLEVTAELKRLKDEAPDTLPPEPLDDYLRENFYGPLSKIQLGRMIPGFIRVEVLLDESKYPSQKELDPIKVDLDFEMEDKDGIIRTQRRTFDPLPCCSVLNVDKLPKSPSYDQIMLWETSIFGANVRNLPTEKSSSNSNMLDWVLLQTGPKTHHMNAEQFVGGYWSGRDGHYGDAVKLGEAHPKFIAQQGGWMATREQLIDMHRNQCAQGFFPQFDEPAFNEDGLLFENVEFWSGGYQVVVGFGKGCNMQRVISLHPDHFSKHFVYHTANNKQKSQQITNDRKVKANNFFGQLNSVVKAAKKKINNN